MAIERNAVIKLHKSEKSNVEIAQRLASTTVWKIVKKLQETGTTLDRPWRGRKRSVRSPQLLKNTREKPPRISRWSCRTLTTIASVSKYFMRQVLRDDLRVKSFKMCITRSLRKIMWAWGSKNAEKFSRRGPTPRCRISCSRTKRYSISSRW